ncbi:MAG: hypothetical protein ACYTGG_12975 [Planctomycetota bacterium]|jgi:hypothetical protein
MHPRRISILTCLLCGLLLLPAVAPAAPQEGGGGGGRFGDAEATVINLDFPGGTAAEYVEAIRKTGAPVNVVTLNDLSAVRVPPMTLKRVEIAAAVMLLQGMADRMEAPSVYLDVEQPAAASPGSTAVFTIQAQPRTNRAAPRGRAQTMVVSVRDILEAAINVEDLLTAIETALEQLRHEYEPADIKFHEATSLLICRGQPGQTDAIEQVIQQISYDMEVQRVRRDQTHSIEELTVRLAAMEQDLAATREALEAAEAQRRDYEDEIRSLRIAVEAMQTENQMLQSRNAELERQLKMKSGGGR